MALKFANFSASSPFTLASCLILILLWALPIEAATFYVATNGSDANPGTAALLFEPCTELVVPCVREMWSS